jgi:hypothetical protein
VTNPWPGPCLLYPPKADMCSAARDVRFGPKADMFMDRYFRATEAAETDCTGQPLGGFDAFLS